MTSLQDLTGADVAKAALAVIDKRGDDFAYTPPYVSECLYSADHGNSGSCIFGTALIEELGVPYEAWWEGQEISAILSGGGVEASREELQRLRSVQVDQDSAYRYGELRPLLNQVLALE